MKVIFKSVHDLANALRRAAEAHASDSGPDLGSAWPLWYAYHMAAFNSFDRFAHLPEPVRLNDTIAIHPAGPPPNPHGDRDPDHGFFLRYASPDL
ncbi:hypothetical protein EDD27_8895 [Nonomuraea polychroma]|uniref:Uncharacterized protein n=1 Tax=Nonomuraea polychroma TaxID=46176 RepID=A0A438MJE8_9ACTN|nr:hypothetical protein [Nonomuraea polychroma]RVX46052.1 hypothetical protein EDD27_8895 [Nonomuraea polychroma]